MTRRKRGAPRGNRNALKHGFYSAAFRAHERRVLSQLSPADLTGEIDVVRIALYRFMEAIKLSSIPLDVQAQLAALRAVNLSAQSITSLIHAQVVLAMMSDVPLPEEVPSLQADLQLPFSAGSAPASTSDDDKPSPVGGGQDEEQLPSSGSELSAPGSTEIGGEPLPQTP